MRLIVLVLVIDLPTIASPFSLLLLGLPSQRSAAYKDYRPRATASLKGITRALYSDWRQGRPSRLSSQGQ